MTDKSRIFKIASGYPAGGANTKVLDVYGVGWVPKGPKTQKYNGYFCTTKGWCPEGTPKTQKYKGTFVHKFP